MISQARRIGKYAGMARCLHLTAFAMLGMVLVSGAAPAAETWPSRPVKVIVPHPAGGSVDALARMVTRKLGEKLGQPFVVENRAGANGNLGAGAVASAAPDGYTLLITTTGPLVFNKLIYKSANFDPAKDFTPIVEVASIPLLVVANASVPLKDISELVAYAKANPRKLTYASPGIGSMGHLTAEMLQRDLGIQLTHVPYKGTAPALNDLVAGTVNLSFDLAPSYVEFIRSGALRPLAISSAKRYSLMPDVRTLAEQGARGFDATGWVAVAGPVGLPAEIVKKVNGAVNDYLRSDEGKAMLVNFGMEALGGTPEDLASYMASELTKWRPLAEKTTVE